MRETFAALRSGHVVRLLGLALLVVILSSLDWGRFRSLAQLPRPGAVLLASLLISLMHFMKGLRWHWIATQSGFGRGLVASYLMYLSGLFLGYLTPGRLGELVKVVYARREGAAVEGALVATLVDRVLDLLLMVLFAASWVVVFGWARLGLAEALVLFVVLAALAALGWALGLRLIDGILGTATVGILARRFERLGLDVSAGRLSGALRAFGTVRFAALLAFSVPVWLVYYAAIHVLATSVGTGFTFAESVGMGAVGSLASLVPVTVAGLGTREGALVLVAGIRGYSAEAAVAFSAVMLGVYGLSLILTVHGWWLWRSRDARPDEAPQR